MIADPHQIQRLRFTPGQDLLARDFRDGATFEARLRHWHNRAVHQAYGVSFGLRVEMDDLTFAVKVDPGLAYDATGRELILTTAKTVDVPVFFKSPHLLVLRHGGGLLWIPEERLQPCDSVPLARATNGSPGSILDPDFRPLAARGLARPWIGYGSTTLGATPWQAETFVRKFGPSTIPIPIVSLRVEVDTRAAGFTQLPCYFGWLQGGIPSPIERTTLDGKKIRPYLPLFPSLEAETPQGFRLRVLLRTPLDSTLPIDPRQWAAATAQQTLSLCWLGLQMQPATQSSSEVSHGNS